ncbi:hypothetical protein JOQ06_006737 [Pogonophryne albipinna]|uniref:Uncharacterized protein n=1 Tax=Pogonophryne albipinna TaxID=1090488 RepID=A0AAD6AZR4_9TELE|nr:hypothetical protein JOQ06_006737 [Pogonophryne albipinna]
MQCYCGVTDNTSVWFCPRSPPFHFVNGGYLWVKSCNHILPQQPEMTTSGLSEASEMMTQRDKVGNERGGGGSIPGDRSSKGSWERVVGGSLGDSESTS